MEMREVGKKELIVSSAKKVILEKGHINDCVRVAIKAGLEPIEAIRAVTLNTAQIYRLDKRGAIAPSYFADMLVIDNLKGIF